MLRSVVRVPRGIVVLLLALVAAGCGDGVGQRYPVEGKVLVDNKPLRGKSGSVLFKPDASKGNTSTVDAGGSINDEGGYSLITKGKPGAPVGWYKVVVFANEKGADRDVVRPLFHTRFTKEAETTLSVEVVTEPTADRYDLKLSRQ
jgi:hypothetical protein